MANRSIRPAANTMRSHQKNPEPHKMAGTVGEAFDAIQDTLDQLSASVAALSAAAAATSTSTSSSSSTGRPTQYSTADGSLTGAIDGVNVTFPLPVAAGALAVYRNGVLMTQGASGDYTVAGGAIVFAASQTPQPGPPIDIITVLIWS